MKTKALKQLVSEKLATGMSKQAVFDELVSSHTTRIHDIATAVRDIASNRYKEKYNKLNFVLIMMTVLVAVLQSITSFLFIPSKALETLPSDIFLLITYIGIAIGIFKYYKLAFSGLIFISIISIYMSINHLQTSLDKVVEMGYYVLIGIIDLGCIAISSILYSKYFRGYQIKEIGVKGDSNWGEKYTFKEEL